MAPNDKSMAPNDKNMILGFPMISVYFAESVWPKAGVHSQDGL